MIIYIKHVAHPLVGNTYNPLTYFQGVVCTSIFKINATECQY